MDRHRSRRGFLDGDEDSDEVAPRHRIHCLLILLPGRGRASG